MTVISVILSITLSHPDFSGLCWFFSISKDFDHMNRIPRQTKVGTTRCQAWGLCKQMVQFKPYLRHSHWTNNAQKYTFVYDVHVQCTSKCEQLLKTWSFLCNVSPMTVPQIWLKLYHLFTKAPSLTSSAYFGLSRNPDHVLKSLEILKKYVTQYALSENKHICCPIVWQFLGHKFARGTL